MGSMARSYLIIITVSLLFWTGCGAVLGSVFDLFISPEIKVSTHNMTFSATEGENPDTQQITASCTYPDDDSINYSDEDECGADVTADQEWLSAEPTEVYGLETVNVSVNTEGLEPGVYSGNIHVEYQLVSPDDEEDISVELTINPADESE